MSQSKNATSVPPLSRASPNPQLLPPGTNSSRSLRTYQRGNTPPNLGRGHTHTKRQIVLTSSRRNIFRNATYSTATTSNDSEGRGFLGCTVGAPAEKVDAHGEED